MWMLLRQSTLKLFRNLNKALFLLALIDDDLQSQAEEARHCAKHYHTNLLTSTVQMGHYVTSGRWILTVKD